MPQAVIDDNDPLGDLILEVLPFVEEDRADGVRRGPIEQWMDALAICWARERLAALVALAW